MELLVRHHPVREALRARRRPLIRLRVREPEPREAQDLVALARDAGVPVEICSVEDLQRGLPQGVKHQGFVLEAGELPVLSLDDLLSQASEGGRAVVALDGVEDPQNLGAIARCAHAAGVAGLVLGRHRSAPLSPAVSRASAGAIEHLRVAQVVNVSRALATLKDRGFWVVGADARAPEGLFASADRFWKGDLVFVFGAEGRGIRPGLDRQIDVRFSIPMAGAVASLNVAAAAAVFLYEWVRRRQAGAG